MNEFIVRFVDQARVHGFFPETPSGFSFRLSCINKAEVYLSFSGNCTCTHRTISSGSYREDLLSPVLADNTFRHIARYSVLESLRKIRVALCQHHVIRGKTSRSVGRRIILGVKPFH